MNPAKRVRRRPKRVCRRRLLSAVAAAAGHAILPSTWRVKGESAEARKRRAVLELAERRYEGFGWSTYN